MYPNFNIYLKEVKVESDNYYFNFPYIFITKQFL